MRFIDKTVTLDCNYPLEWIHPDKKIIFFDIETTGLSVHYSTFYLIGCVYPEKDIWHLRQWLSDGLRDELQVLQEFFEFIKQFQVMIHFNGERFDLPYLSHCANQYGMETNFEQLIQIDLLKKIRPYKTILGLSNLKQKSLEHFLHIYREDIYNGGELIPVYEQYQQSKDENLLHLLLLHNEDDLKGMLQLLPLLYYERFFSPDLALTNPSFFAINDNLISLQCEYPFSLPNSLHLETNFGLLQVRQSLITFELPVFQGELKYFYPDYKNYYYLPAEDVAIHQKIAQFVDKEHKKKATAATAYTKKTATFLPLGEKWKVFEKNSVTADIPIFRQEHNSKIAWILLEEDYNRLLLYIRFLLSQIRA